MPQVISQYEQVVRIAGVTTSANGCITRNAANTGWEMRPVYSRSEVDAAVTVVSDNLQTHVGQTSAVHGASTNNVSGAIVIRDGQGNFLANTIGLAANLALGGSSPVGASLRFAESAVAAGGIAFGTDTNLYRSAESTLKSDGIIQAVSFEGVGSGVTDIQQANVTGLTAALTAKAPTASPTFTGTVTVPAPSTSSDTTIAATTAWVRDLVGVDEANDQVLHILDHFDDVRIYDLTTADTDPYGLLVDTARAGLFFGRFNLGLHEGLNRAVWKDALRGQYSFGGGWSIAQKGTTGTSPGDGCKGSLTVGYQLIGFGPYSTTTGINNIAGSACIAIGSGCTAGYSSLGTGLDAIVSMNHSTRQVVYTGDVTTRYATNQYVAMRQNDGGSNETTLGLLQVTNSSFAAGQTTVTYDTITGAFNGTALTKTINVNTPTLACCFAGGSDVHVHSFGSFAYGQTITLATGTTNSFAGGSNITNTGGSKCIQLGDTLTCGTGNNTIQIGSSLTQTTHAFVTGIGHTHTSGNHRTTALGILATPKTIGEIAWNNGMALAATGTDAKGQGGIMHMGRTVTHSTTAWSSLYNSHDGSVAVPFMPTNTGFAILALVQGIKTTGGVKSISFLLFANVHRASGASYTVKGQSLTSLDADDTSFDCRVDVSGGFMSIEVSDSDAAGDVVQWIATVIYTRSSTP